MTVMCRSETYKSIIRMRAIDPDQTLNYHYEFNKIRLLFPVPLENSVTL